MAHSFRQLDLTIISAQDLNIVNLLSKMDVYVEATLSGHPGSKQRTPTHDKGHKNPSWNTKFQFSIPDNVDHSTFSIHIVLRAQKVLGDRVIGEVHIPIRELESDPKSLESNKLVSYQVRKPCGNFEGTLNLSYRFSHSPPPPETWDHRPAYATAQSTSAPHDVAQTHPPPITVDQNNPPAGYPPPYAGVQNYQGYPPPPAGWYPPPPAGGHPYGVHPQMEPPSEMMPKRRTFGLALGTGLLGVGAVQAGNLFGETLASLGGDGGVDDAGV